MTWRRIVNQIKDPIPLEDRIEFSPPSEMGLRGCSFFAFNTVILIEATGVDDSSLLALRDRCREFERLFSRTLPHSDITRINEAHGEPVKVAPETFELLQAALGYCAESRGLFDITIGSASRLWNFHEGTAPDAKVLEKAIRHVDWRCIELIRQGQESIVRMGDPQASLDVGGIAKGYIADALAAMLDGAGSPSFLINLGGNVYARGRKPDGSRWTIGLQDPRGRGLLAGAVEIEDASAVTSGVYERCFVQGDTLYHHILHPRTGQPVATDIAGVTVVCRRSIDAEGYSTTLLALGRKRARIFATAHPEIEQLHLVDLAGNLV